MFFSSPSSKTFLFIFIFLFLLLLLGINDGNDLWLSFVSACTIKKQLSLYEKKKKVAGKTTQIELIKFTLKQFTN